MKGEYLRKTPVKIREKFFRNIEVITDYSVGLSDDELTEFNYNTIKEINDFVPVKIYNINGEIFIYATNKKLYKYSENTWKFIHSDIPEIPVATEIIDKGERKALFIWGTSGIIAGENVTIIQGLPEGDNVTFFDGRLFVSNNDTLYMSKPYDFSLTEIPDENFDIVTPVKNYGKIEGMFSVNDSLYVIYERAVMNLKKVSYDTNYIFIKIETGDINVTENTLTKIGEKIIFVGDNRVNVLDDGNYKMTENIIRKQFTVGERSFACKNYYILPVTDVENNKLYYVYDTIKNKSFYIFAESFINCEGGYFIDRTLKNLNKFEYNGSKTTMSKWKSKEMDFEDSREKAIMEISLVSSHNFILTVSGKYGKMDYYFSKGITRKKVYIQSDMFELMITSDSANIKVKNLSIKYRIMEDK